MRPTRRRGPIVSCARRGRGADSSRPGEYSYRWSNEFARSAAISLTKTLAGFLRRGLVDSTLSGYLLQHLLGQHFPLPLQQSAAGDVAVAVLMNAAKVAIKRRYFIRS